MKTAKLLSAAAVVALAGRALGQPVIDGTRDNAFYGTTPLWVQNQPTGFGDNTVVICDPNNVGSPGAVNKGVELAIPLSALLTSTGQVPNLATLKIAGFINSSDHTFLSNQAIGGMPVGTVNLGEPRTVNFATIAGGISGNQFVTGVSTVGSAPVLDGTKDAIYGAAKFTQTVRTQFGDATTGTPDFCNGSEIDALYAVATATTLYVFVAGNLESNNNKLELFFDTDASIGQNKLVGTNPLIAGGGGLNRMGDDGSGNGLTFDPTFTADYYVAVGGQDQGGGVYGIFVDYARLQGVPTGADAGVGFYCGLGTAQSGGGLTGGESSAPAILATIDNSNTAGVGPTCPPPTGNPDVANGSEIDAVYGQIFGGRLYLFIAGNLETNGNTLNLFFDVQSGGQNQLGNKNPIIDFAFQNNVNIGGLNRLGDDGSGTNGLKWDADFSPDYFLSVKSFVDGQQHVQFFSHSAVIRTDGQIVNGNGFPLDYGAFDGGLKSSLVNGLIPYAGPRIDAQTGFITDVYANYGVRTASASLQATPLNPVGTPNLVAVALNNSNLAGVSGVNVNDPNATGTTTGADQVTTGLEIAIDLTELTSACIGAGCPNITSVKVAGFINSGNYDFVSNQVIGGIPNTVNRAYAVNLGDPRSVDFTQLGSNHHYVLVTTAGPTTGACCVGGASASCQILSPAACATALGSYNGNGSTCAPAHVQGQYTCCYANCDGTTGANCVNVNDFICFITQYGLQAPTAPTNSYANCDGTTGVTNINVNDFICFIGKYSSGCSSC